jgi:hypothetical protein
MNCIHIYYAQRIPASNVNIWIRDEYKATETTLRLWCPTWPIKLQNALLRSNEDKSRQVVNITGTVRPFGQFIKKQVHCTSDKSHHAGLYLHSTRVWALVICRGFSSLEDSSCQILWSAVWRLWYTRSGVWRLKIGFHVSVGLTFIITECKYIRIYHASIQSVNS